MDIYKIIGNAILLTIVWMVFSWNAHQYRQHRPPRANIVQSQPIEFRGQSIAVPMPNVDDIKNANIGLAFMTEEGFQEKVREHKRTRRNNGIITVIFGVAVFLIGARLGEHWAYGLACLFFGPVAVAYTGYRRSKFT